MGICDSRKNENIQIGSELIQNDRALLQVSKSLCKIETKKKMGSGFLIRFFKGQESFFCLMTNEHIINKDMIKRKETITFYFDMETETRDLILNSEERYIKTFRDINIDATVIEIISEDNIPINYFLKPNIDYVNDTNELINKEIAIIQYPSGVSSHSYGKIITKKNYEFAHTASTLKGSSGSPIFLKYSPQVLGIHKQGGYSENYGDFIGPIFQYFKNYYKTDKNNKKRFIFRCNNGFSKEIYFNPNNTIKDLIKSFFKEIKQPKLFNDEEIRFLSKGQRVNKNSNELISEFWDEELTVGNAHYIIIMDNNRKINYLLSYK